MASIAMPLAEDFEDVEFKLPYEQLRAAGHGVTIFGSEDGVIVHGKRQQESVAVERSAKDLHTDDFDALVIPGGYSPDHLRTSTEVVAFVRAFFDTGKPVAAICHAAQLLIEAGVVKGKTLTSWPSVRTDLRNAGATWVDEPVYIDGNLITSRKPDDLEDFINTILEHLQQPFRLNTMVV